MRRSTCISRAGGHDCDCEVLNFKQYSIYYNYNVFCLLTSQRNHIVNVNIETVDRKNHDLKCSPELSVQVSLKKIIGRSICCTTTYQVKIINLSTIPVINLLKKM